MQGHDVQYRVCTQKPPYPSTVALLHTISTGTAVGLAIYRQGIRARQAHNTPGMNTLSKIGKLRNTRVDYNSSYFITTISLAANVQLNTTLAIRLAVLVQFNTTHALSVAVIVQLNTTLTIS